MFKLIIADDEPRIREGLLKIVDWTALGFEVAGCYADGTQVLAREWGLEGEALRSAVAQRNPARYAACRDLPRAERRVCSRARPRAEAGVQGAHIPAYDAGRTFHTVLRPVRYAAAFGCAQPVRKAMNVGPVRLSQRFPRVRIHSYRMTGNPVSYAPDSWDMKAGMLTSEPLQYHCPSFLLYTEGIYGFAVYHCACGAPAAAYFSTAFHPAAY